MKTLIALIACALAAAAAADEPKTESQKQRPALNLRLDETTSAAPRVTFDAPTSATTKQEREKGLPELGGRPSRAYERSTAGDASSVIPNAMDPYRPAESTGGR